MDLCQQSDVSAFNMLPGFVIAFFFRRSKGVLISWVQSPFAVIIEPKKVRSASVSIISPSICNEVMGLDAMIFVFWMLSFKPTFSLSSFTFIKRLFSYSLLSPIRVVSFAYLLLLPLSRFSSVQLYATPWTGAYQAPPSMGFSRQEYWSGMPSPSPKNIFRVAYLTLSSLSKSWFQDVLHWIRPALKR